MEKYKVEYLTIINSKEDFCKSIASFNSFLQSYDNIKISGSKIKFGGATFHYEIQYGDIVEDVQRYFHVKFICEDLKFIDQFKAMLRAIRTLLSKASGKPPEVLWDDVSSELASRAYPIVHELENLMRKLITKFMFIKIGLAWTKDAVPKEVSESIKTKKEGYSNYLYEVDFIQLSNFLFREYSTANSRKLVEKLGAAKKIEELDLNELQELVPRSNWERYFAPIVNCKIEYLQPRWEKLYLLRCMVAHNNLMGESDFNEVCVLSAEVKEKLTQALDGLDKIHVTTEQKEDVAENAASEINSYFGDFISEWNQCVALVHELTYLADIDVDKYLAPGQRVSVMHMLAGLVNAKVIDEADGVLIEDLYKIRNSVVHNSSFGDEGLDVRYYFDLIGYVRSILSELVDRYSSR
ncbi:hypothetical protein [Pseudomonas paraglycinae]|uniref:hypothetical protein n=1 Tax=Pseudomonas paraglycinae TaxID=2892330 RepID=UPI003FD504AE